MSTADEDGIRYKDKVTIVTGGSRGIGRSCVETFGVILGRSKGKDSHNEVIMTSLQELQSGPMKGLEELGLELQSNLKKSITGEATFIKCDVTREDEIKRLVQTAVDTYGRIDCLINNAGKTQGITSIDTLTADEFRMMNEVNVIAPFMISKLALPYIRKTKGNIINMCSMSGVVGQGNSTAYTPTKAALIGLTKTLAVDESKHGVRVNGVSPGPIHTPLFDFALSTANNPAKYMEYRSKHQQFMGRLGKPEEIALACLYLAADATYSTGLNLYASGGAELDYGFKANIDQFLC